MHRHSMNTDPASLDNLREIILPPPVPWWPLAARLVGAVRRAVPWPPSLVAFRAWRTWRAERLSPCCTAGTCGSAASVAAIAEILKRTALVAYPRTDVASLVRFRLVGVAGTRPAVGRFPRPSPKR